MDDIQPTRTKAPTMMTIINAVAEKSGLLSTSILSARRGNNLFRARAAVYRIASDYGYEKPEIMYYLDRHRTSAYCYEEAMSGWLRTDPPFKALYAQSSERVRELPLRIVLTQQNARQRPTRGDDDEVSECESTEPRLFADWRGELGWEFSAEECYREWVAKREAEAYMATL